jgi:hypothetical protein
MPFASQRSCSDLNIRRMIHPYSHYVTGQLLAGGPVRCRVDGALAACLRPDTAAAVSIAIGPKRSSAASRAQRLVGTEMLMLAIAIPALSRMGAAIEMSPGV